MYTSAQFKNEFERKANSLRAAGAFSEWITNEVNQDFNNLELDVNHVLVEYVAECKKQLKSVKPSKLSAPPNAAEIFLKTKATQYSNTIVKEILEHQYYAYNEINRHDVDKIDLRNSVTREKYIKTLHGIHTQACSDAQKRVEQEKQNLQKLTLELKKNRLKRDPDLQKAVELYEQSLETKDEDDDLSDWDFLKEDEL